MNKDQVKGGIKQGVGKVQQKVGEAVGSEKQQAKGLSKQAAGKIQKTYGDAKDNSQLAVYFGDLSTVPFPVNPTQTAYR